MSDKDGYPTDDELEQLLNWDPADRDGALQFLQEHIWQYSNHISQDGDKWWVSTGGWSGHEDALGALAENFVWWSMYWYSSRRGGHYQFGEHGDE